MAATQLSDVIIPAVYASYQAVASPEKTAFFDAGVAVRNAMLDNFADNGGTVMNVPFWKDLDSTVEPNYSSDSTSTSAVPQKVTAGIQKARQSSLNQSYSAADLVSELAGSDPMVQIRNRFGRYWQRQWQRRTLAMFAGVLNANVAGTQNQGTAGDMVINISIPAGLSATSANLFSRAAFTAAAFTMGDAEENIVAIAVHSVVYMRMVNNNDITFIRPSDGSTQIPTYLGRRVIVDDGMPVVAGGTNGFVYTSIMFGSGAIGYGEGSPKIPVEVWRQPLLGNGGGVETLIERQTWIIHPFGYQWLSATESAQSPTLADLRLATNWSRQIERKNVPVAFLQTNG